MFMKEKTATIIGHDDCSGIDDEHLRAELAKLAESGVTTFLSGGYGGFDRLCARRIYELKPRYPHIRSIIVIPYLDHKIFAPELFDGSEFPECLEGVPYRFRISHRNRYMVECAAHAVCFVTRSFGGAARTYRYAQNQGLNIIDINKRQHS